MGKEFAQKKVLFTETVLRDANQSLIATRLPYSKFADILPTMDKAGYYSVECWGGAVFDVCLRYLDEDPWQRLRNLRKAMPNTKLQMLLRGQNLLGYKHYPDEIVKMFVEKSVDNGIDIIRIFDALNDVRNLETATKTAIKCGATVSGAISYTQSPVHTLDAFAKLAKQLEEMGVATICVKDMAGTMTPFEAYELIGAIKNEVKIPVVLHTHCTTGMAYMTYMKAIEAGVDVIDTATSCFSGGTSQPATETMRYSKKSTISSNPSETAISKTALSIPRCSRRIPTRSPTKCRAVCFQTSCPNSKRKTLWTNSSKCLSKRQRSERISVIRRS